ncbi:hypothetical protein BVY04_02665 [bacterium M21]|nr:hypothetical protein BVY04_02665 [bacterium M21]
MPIDIEIVVHDDYLEVDVTGEYDEDEASDKFTQVLLACRKQEKNKILFDYRRLEGDTAAIEKVLYAFTVHEHYEHHLEQGGRPLRLAYLGDEHAVNSFVAGLAMSHQKGAPFLMTHDREEAWEWLFKD